MFKHLFRLMWNKKRAHTLLIVEILASFLVLFGVTSLIVYNLRNYTQPIGFDYKNVWTIDFNARDTPDSLVADLMERIRDRTKAYPQVEAVTLFGSNAPYTQNTHNNGIMHDKMFTMAHVFPTDLDMPRTLNVPVIEGRWFNKSDQLEDARTIVINQPLRQKFFGNGPVLGKLLYYGGPDNKDGKRQYMKVIGVTSNFKSHGEYQANTEGVFELSKGKERSWLRTMLVKVKPGTDANFEAQLTKDLGAMTPGWNMDVSYMENQRQNTHKITLIPIIVFLVVSGFLLINVALGLFGILNLNIAKRRSEIGLRRALGATGSGISAQFVGEIWVLATFGLLIGLLFAVQFPLMNVFDLDAGIYLTAIAISVVVIYLIVTLCALYPSRQAATIQPAMALHEE